MDAPSTRCSRCWRYARTSRYIFVHFLVFYLFLFFLSVWILECVFRHDTAQQRVFMSRAMFEYKAAVMSDARETSFSRPRSPARRRALISALSRVRVSDKRILTTEKNGHVLDEKRVVSQADTTTRIILTSVISFKEVELVDSTGWHDLSKGSLSTIFFFS